MKASIRIIAVGLVASLAVVSCAKQNVMDNNADSVERVRTIAVSFANASVKSALGEDGLTPKFVANDVIKVSNGSAAEYCFVSIDGSGNASITTTLTGTLTAVYPAAAAKMKGNAIEGVLVPTVQDGTFASANICKAEIAAGATSATFENQTAVFCITPGAGASTKYVELITAGAEIANSVPAGSEYNTMHKIHVASASAAPVYVSILVPTGLKFRDLSFADGNNMKTLMDDTDAIAVNSLYTVTNENWSRPYVDLQMTVGGKTRTYKWATMNVGATTPEEYGWYFFWAGTEGYVYDSINSKWVKASDPTAELSGGFNWVNTPYQTQNTTIHSSTKFTKYLGSTTSSYKDPSATDADALKTALDLEDDVANVNWGGSWRMPTIAEFDALCAMTPKRWDDDKKGYTFGTSPNQIFLPAAGYGENTKLYYTGQYSRYWSSSLNTDNPYYAFAFYFYDSSVYTSHYYRSHGRSVRPVSD